MTWTLVLSFDFSYVWVVGFRNYIVLGLVWSFLYLLLVFGYLRGDCVYLIVYVFVWNVWRLNFNLQICFFEFWMFAVFVLFVNLRTLVLIELMVLSLRLVVGFIRYLVDNVTIFGGLSLFVGLCVIFVVVYWFVCGFCWNWVYLKLLFYVCFDCDSCMTDLSVWNCFVLTSYDLGWYLMIACLLLCLCYVCVLFVVWDMLFTMKLFLLLFACLCC